MAWKPSRVIAASFLSICACGGSRAAVPNRSGERVALASSGAASRVLAPEVRSPTTVPSAEPSRSWDCAPDVPPRPPEPPVIPQPDESVLSLVAAGLSHAGPPTDARACPAAAQWATVQPGECADPDQTMAALAVALETSDVRERDRKLARLAARDSLLAGLVSARGADFDLASSDLVPGTVVKNSRIDEAPDLRPAQSARWLWLPHGRGSISLPDAVRFLTL